MADDGFNMSLRKFVKRVGVTSQQKIEEAVRAADVAGKLAGRDQVRAKVVLTLPDLGEEHELEGDIALKDHP